MEKEGEIILYQPDGTLKLEVRLEDETVWLNRQQLSNLFDRDIKTIGKHIGNALKEELSGMSVVAKFATTAADGKTYQVEYYNLDMILSIGYRVKSRRGVEFRQWANQVLKDYLLKGYSINRRIEQLEKTVARHDERIEFFVRTSLPPVEGIFFEGQIFDAYAFASDLVKSARQRIVLIDNYVDESTLMLLSKRKPEVEATIFTARISQALQLDIQRYNAEYPPITVNEYRQSHDRFLIIDADVYHIGASLKDLGKKWFAFSRLHFNPQELLERIK
ncbi:virulence RhuM family protein [Mediterranea massiliensis]|uniref:virulence RhuM family protein n=1 Tax=Mediterranea massiliensis TaxID=1841865 RepID=UPI0025A42C1D|nr:RhuM family protein [Mediterranea massiliensis]MDM8338162.1 RhuM family protein [Mediterranea massiliensis]